MKLRFKEKYSAMSKVLVVAAFITFSSITFGGCQGPEAQASSSNLLAESAISPAVNTVIDLDGSNFAKVIEKGVVLVDFWAAWCGPCRVQLPIIDELAAEIGDKAVITKLDVDKNRALAQQFGVRSIPTLLIFKDGKVEKRFQGVTQKHILVAAINELLKN